MKHELKLIDVHTHITPIEDAIVPVKMNSEELLKRYNDLNIDIIKIITMPIPRPYDQFLEIQDGKRKYYDYREINQICFVDALNNGIDFLPIVDLLLCRTNKHRVIHNKN